MEIRKKILTDSKGEAGIGTLIIFIAVVLIAGVTAAMFIYSGGTLQKKALNSSDKVSKSSDEEERLSTWMTNVNKLNISTPMATVTPTVTSTTTPSNSSTPTPTPTP